MSNAAASESNHRGGSHSGQWGLSAILIGGLVVFMFPIIVMSLFGAMTGAFHNDFLKPNDIDLGISATYAMVFGLLFLSVIAVGCAVVGVLSGFVRRQPMGLSIGGTVLAVVAVVLAVILLLIAQRCIDWARDYQNERFAVKLNFGR
jgi:hypothetical protein